MTLLKYLDIETEASQKSQSITRHSQLSVTWGSILAPFFNPKGVEHFIPKIK